MLHLNSPWQLGNLCLPNRLIQGPLAGYSCAPFRALFYDFIPPAYCVTEMCSAVNVLTRDTTQSRFLYRSPQEHRLSYQISGTDPAIMRDAASLLQAYGADLIDINCGCPKNKIRKKGAGSALLEQPQKLIAIIKAIKSVLSIPLTVKIRIQGMQKDLLLAQKIQESGADALIIHGRYWFEDYDVPCNLEHIAQIKKNLEIPVIANGDIKDAETLKKAMELTGCDAWMIGRAGSGKPWIYQEFLEQKPLKIGLGEKINLFMQHLEGLASLENEFKALLQSKSLVRYYFRNELSGEQMLDFYKLDSLLGIDSFLRKI